MSRAQAEATIDRAIGMASAVRVAPGGRLLYWDAEQGSGTLYATVARILSNQWGRHGNDVGLRHIEVARPPHGRTVSEGTWTRPDLVMAAYPRRRQTANAPKELHAIEVERIGGFDIRSVYQAYEQARGAHFAWVFAHANVVDPRILTAAGEVGVGVVAFPNPNSVATYRTVARAKPRVGASPAEFIRRCFPQGTDKLTGWEPTAS
jgi:hypothetical protein